VAVGARKPLARVVIRMAERVTIRARIRARRSIRFLVVTNSTRCDLAAGIRFTGWRVTGVTIVMRRDVRRNRQTHATIERRVMTARTAARRARRTGHMLCVIELDVEWFVEARGKSFQRRIVAADVRVADLAHRDLRRGELAAMAISARFVTGKTWCRRVVGALVTPVAGEGTVALAVVKKLRIIDLRYGRLEEKKYSRKDAKAQSELRHYFASLRLCGRNLFPHLTSLRLIGGRSAIK
jgi:hypothetical protein